MSDEEESEESKDTQLSHKSSPVSEDIQPTDGTQITDGTSINAKTEKVTKEGTPVQDLNPFFTLAASTTCTWAQHSTPRTKLPLHPKQSSADLATHAVSQSVSVNYLDSPTMAPETELEKDPPASVTTMLTWQFKISELRSVINKMQKWKEQATIQIAHASIDATRATGELDQTDIHELRDKIQKLKDTAVQHENKKRSRDHELDKVRQENERLMNRNKNTDIYF
jgi:hypothetical protein